jgi:hypothetical protein
VAVAAESDLLRIVIDPNGTARWYNPARGLRWLLRHDNDRRRRRRGLPRDHRQPRLDSLRVTGGRGCNGLAPTG